MRLVISNGFRGRDSPWPQLDTAQTQWGNLLRTTIASMAIMMNHVHMAARTLKKEIPMEIRNMADIVRPLMRKKRTVVGS